MNWLLAVPAGLGSACFMGGGVYAYALKRSVVSLLVATSISASYAVGSYVILALPAENIGYCFSATVSICSLGMGIYRTFFQKHRTIVNRNTAIPMYTVGLASTFFYLGVVLTRKFMTC